MHSSSISNHIPTRKLDNHSNRKKQQTWKKKIGTDGKCTLASCKEHITHLISTKLKVRKKLPQRSYISVLSIALVVEVELQAHTAYEDISPSMHQK
jgi:hypothetical protein